ncbi:MAG: DUF4418 family protein, partial [Negativicutes bacterium]|nr:DUF4418 family protein [Negativicutes bacterium]
MNSYKAVAWSAVLVSLALLVLPRIVPICTGLTKTGSPMQCHFAFQAEFLITLLALILSGALLVLRTAEAKFLAGFVILLLGLVIVIIPQPWALGLCEDGGACHRTGFFETIGGALLVLTGLGALWLSRKTE